MATITSTATGNWAAGGTWTGGVAPGTGDTAQIQAAHVVTVAAALTAIKKIEVTGGLVVNYAITFDDATGAGIEFEDNTACSFTTGASASAPLTISSASTVPNYPWTITYNDHSGVDARTIDFDYVVLQGNHWMLGNSSNYIQFNANAVISATNPIITGLTPPMREPLYDEHNIRGRNKGRIYYRGASSATMNVSGVAHKDGHMATQLRELVETRRRVAFFSSYYHMPFCRIERYSVRQRSGEYEDFSIALVEDA